MIRRGDFVRWNPLIAKKFREFPNPDYWDGEPLDCLMEVHQGVNGVIHLDCTNSCGIHSINDITEEEYNEYSSILCGKVLVAGSINDVVEADFVKGMLEKALDPSEDEIEEYDPQMDVCDYMEENAPKYVDRLLKQ